MSCGQGRDTEISVLDLASTEGHEFQIGSRWDKTSVPLSAIREYQTNLSHAARISAQYRTPHSIGTIVYLGKFQNIHLAATNAHVVSRNRDCLSTPYVQHSNRVFFRNTLSHIFCSKKIAVFPSIDFALIELKELDGHNHLATLPRSKMNFFNGPSHGTPLLSVGYGKHRNILNNQKAVYDSHCKIFSHTKETREIKSISKTETHPSKKVWSMSIGCEVSPGDSGSGLFNRDQVGLIEGFVWAGQFPKPLSFHSDQYIESVFNNKPEEAWNYLNYGVPSNKIYEIVHNWLRSQTTANWKTKIIRQFLSELAN